MVPVIVAVILVCIFPAFGKWLVIGMFVSIVMNTLQDRG